MCLGAEGYKNHGDQILDCRVHVFFFFLFFFGGGGGGGKYRKQYHKVYLILCSNNC